MKREIRNITSPIEIRKGENGEESRHIEGYALVFDSRSEDLGGFTETIAAGALEGVLERSDILALLDHNIGRGVLARYRNGGGSLRLDVDDKGLKYSFEAPNTPLGDELLEGIRRGDITGSSFAFTVEDDHWERKSDETYLRTILKFDRLFDVSPVYHPAYSDTTVVTDTRGLEKLKLELRACESEDDDQESKKNDGSKDEDSCPEDEKTPDNNEKKANGEDDAETGDESGEEKKDGDKEEKEESDRDLKEINIIHRSMKKEKFSLLKAISNAANREDFDEAASVVMAEGRRAAEAAGVETSGSIQIPFEMGEKRYENTPNGIIASQTPEGVVAGMGGEVVPTELFDILGPLRDRLVVSQLGARMLNLTGNVDIPLYSGANAEWESEIGRSKETAGKFTVVKMSPKRLSATLPISKQFLIQTSPSAEALLRQNLIDCLADKFQSTMFGDGAGDDVTPQGLFFGVTPETAAFKYSDCIDWEAELEEARIFGEKKYLVAPSSKAIMRSTKIDAGSGLMVMQNNEVTGIPALCTGAVVKKGVILADWSQLYIGTFGALDIVVDPYSRKKHAQVEITVNAWLDYVPVRPEAFVKKILK